MVVVNTGQVVVVVVIVESKVGFGYFRTCSDSDPAESLEFSFRLKNHIRQEKTGLKPLQHSYADSNYASQQQVRGKGGKRREQMTKISF